MALGIFTTIANKIERALRNGERLHLTIDEVRALYASDAGRWLVLTARDELVAEFAPAIVRNQIPDEPPQPNAALTPEHAELVDDAARRQALDAVDDIKKNNPRRRRHPKAR